MVFYVDGSCSGNPGPGACAWFNLDSRKFYVSQLYPKTTNNRMELMAVIRVLQWILINFKGLCIRIHSDSIYVVKGFNEGLNGWRLRNFKGVKNICLGRYLEMLGFLLKSKDMVLKLAWVKGHSQDRYNDLVHRLCFNKVRFGYVA